MPIEATLAGLYHRRKEAERFSQTATSAEARAWWTKEARAADRMIKAREKIDALNKQFKPPAIHLQGAFLCLAAPLCGFLIFSNLDCYACFSHPIGGFFSKRLARGLRRATLARHKKAP
ncbi:MAG: hypothetical protein IKO72_09050 [Kiritimatiellae bacterium]|nr:hypothetical protein [Kiritimatiellia bacterium]